MAKTKDGGAPREERDLTVDTLGYQWLRKAKTYTPKIVVNTKITHDAGHRIPDG